MCRRETESNLHFCYLCSEIEHTPKSDIERFFAFSIARESVNLVISWSQVKIKSQTKLAEREAFAPSVIQSRISQGENR
jgi:hypothetical protein